MAAQEAAEASGRDVPLMISMTITDMAGAILSGHTVQGFWNTIRHVKPLTIGLNCSFGADLLRPYLAELAKQADALVMAYPNAGLPNELGQYDELPEQTAKLIEAMARRRAGQCRRRLLRHHACAYCRDRQGRGRPRAEAGADRAGGDAAGRVWSPL
jgi:methionine synthase I (cobalamin-dependent)